MESFGELQVICLKVFQAVTKSTAIFILPLFLGRIVFSNVLGEGSKVFTHLKGLVIYFCLIVGFPMIMEMLFSIPESYLPKYQSMDKFLEGSNNASGIGMIPFALDRIIEVLLAGLYWIVYYLHVFFMLVMCSMAPIVFLASTLLGVGLGLEIFMGLLIAGSSWPIIWYGFDQVHLSLVNSQTDAFGAKCLELLLTLFKGLAPVAFASIAIKSPAGKMVSGAARAGISAGRWAYAAPQAAAKFVPSIAKSGNTNISKVFSQNRTNNSKNPKDPKKKSESADRLSVAKNQLPAKKEVTPHENPRPRNIQT